jgi:hypothetical protein
LLAAGELRKRFGERVVRIHDRFENPIDGYSDIIMTVTTESGINPNIARKKMVIPP